MINRSRTCVIRLNYLKRIFPNKVRNQRLNPSSLPSVQDSRRKSCANYAAILRLAKRLLPLLNAIKSNFEIRRNLLPLPQLKMRTIRIRIAARMLAIKISERIMLKRVNKIEELLTRKVREKYLLIKIKTKRILPLKIYLKSNISIMKYQIIIRKNILTQEKKI